MPTPRCLPRHVVLLAGLLAILGLVACGGGDGSGGDRATTPARDVEALARQAFGPNRAATSGRIDGRIDITLKGARRVREPVTLTMSGPFRARPGRSLPDYAIDLSVGDRGVGLSSVRGRSFVTLGTTGYEIPAQVRRRLARSAAKGRNGLTRMLEQFGIAPWRWETNKRVGAREGIDGEQALRIDTGVDVDRFLRDANTLAGVLSSLGIARANGLPERIPRGVRRILVDSVQSARGASWIATSDNVMRKAGLTIDFAVARAQRARLGGAASVKVVAEVLVTGVGSAPAIAALPRTLEPFSSLQLAFDALADDARRSR